VLDGVRLAERSSAACAVVSWQDQLHLAWTGSDRHVNLASSPDGRELTGKQRLSQRSFRTDWLPTYTVVDISLSPSLAVSGERLCLAWTNKGGRRLAVKVLAAGQSADAAPETLDEQSPVGPSLAAGGDDGFVLAWIGWHSYVHLLTLAGDGHGQLAGAGPRTRLEQARSSRAPAVCSHQGSLVLAWTGTDHRVNILPGAGSPDAVPVRLEETRTSCAPAVCSHRGSLIVVWIGIDGRLNVARLQ
jgi:hypothetical protein